MPFTSLKTPFKKNGLDLVARSREAYHTASTLAESVEATMETRQTVESTDLASHKADVDALMAWVIEQKPSFVRMLKDLGDELPPKITAALERLHLDSPDSHPLHEAEQKNKIQSLEADVRAEVERKRLAMREAESVRQAQAEELVQVKETSRKHREQVIELLDELSDF
ncbi:unnamed protein product [Fusarium equiseti]|uniref:Uncharacterized protein n=1 Tax=Fusarium equiseti TaxID=61235 RepID=A0A8J2IK83_FUSEQ|nr:unnamed protein product [Fusarium equiseti]